MLELSRYGVAPAWPCKNWKNSLSGLRHEHVLIAPDRFAIRLHAPVERVELRIRAYSVCIGLRSPRVAFAAHDFRVAIGLGEDNRALPIRVRANSFGVLRAFGANCDATRARSCCMRA